MLIDQSLSKQSKLVNPQSTEKHIFCKKICAVAKFYNHKERARVTIIDENISHVKSVIKFARKEKAKHLNFLLNKKGKDKFTWNKSECALTAKEYLDIINTPFQKRIRKTTFCFYEGERIITEEVEELPCGQFCPHKAKRRHRASEHQILAYKMFYEGLINEFNSLRYPTPKYLLSLRDKYISLTLDHFVKYYNEEIIPSIKVYLNNLKVVFDPELINPSSMIDKAMIIINMIINYTKELKARELMEIEKNAHKVYANMRTRQGLYIWHLSLLANRGGKLVKAKIQQLLVSTGLKHLLNNFQTIMRKLGKETIIDFFKATKKRLGYLFNSNYRKKYFRAQRRRKIDKLKKLLIILFRFNFSNTRT